eukprot:Gb_21233 [translate_table: standard]
MAPFMAFSSLRQRMRPQSFRWLSGSINLAYRSVEVLALMLRTQKYPLKTITLMPILEIPPKIDVGAIKNLIKQVEFYIMIGTEDKRICFVEITCNRLQFCLPIMIVCRGGNLGVNSPRFNGLLVVDGFLQDTFV